MSRVVITVGAQADRSLVDVVRPLVDSAKRARAAATADARAAAKAQGDAAKLAGRMQIAEFQAQAALHRQYVRAKIQAERDAAKESIALQKKASQETQKAEREKAKAVEHVYQIRARAMAQQEREATALGKSRAQTALGYGAGAMRNLGGVMRAGIGVASSLARGAGVNWDLGSLVGSSVDMQKQAVDLSNAAYRGKTGEQRLDPAAIVKQAREIGGEFALDPSKVIGGLGAFQEKSGDLNTGMAGLKEWSAFAKATNTDLDVLIASAGEVSIALGDAFASPQDKAKAITEVLKTLGAQGQEGAVEFRNLATQMPKLSAAAVKFEGDRSMNLKKMGALVQLAKQQGGAPSAASAATSIAGFSNILNTPARVKEFEKAGIDVFSKEKGQEGKLRDPFAIMKDALAKTGMDPLKFKALFANVVGAKPAEALATTYREAGGGEKGQKAVDALLEKFMRSMSDDKLRGDLEASMGTTASKVQLVNNQLAAMGEQLAAKLLPKLIEGAPAIMKFVDSMVGAASWAADNPGKMIVLAITGSIAKAAIGNAVSSGLKTMLEATMTGAGSVGAMGGMGKAGAALGAIAVGVATFTITSAVIDIIGSGVDKGVNKSLSDDAKAGNAISEANALARSGKGTDADVARLSGEQRALEARIEAAKGSRIAQYAMSILPGHSLDAASEASNDAAPDNMKGLQADLAALTAALQGLQGAVKNGVKANVTVTQGPSPGVDPAGRK